MNLFTVQLLLSLLCNLSTALSESADGRLIYTCANAMTVGVRLTVALLKSISTDELAISSASVICRSKGFLIRFRGIILKFEATVVISG